MWLKAHKQISQSVKGSENLIKYAAIAQLVEQGTENPCVLGSIPSCGIFFCVKRLNCNKRDNFQD